MKKILATIALMCTVTVMYGQGFILGTELNYSSIHSEEDDGVRVTSFSFIPQPGYSFNDKHAVFMGVGYGKYKIGDKKLESFYFMPYYEYSIALPLEGLCLNLDCGVSFARTFDKCTNLELFGSFGLEYMLSDRWSACLSMDVFSVGRQYYESGFRYGTEEIGFCPSDFNYTDFSLFSTDRLSVSINYFF